MPAPDFIAKYGDAADSVSQETGIPAERILGQAGLETGWNVNAPGNNFFGMKAGGGYQGPAQNLATHEADASGNLVPTTQSFRAYNAPEDSFRDYGRLIQSGYRGALDPSLDDAGFAKAIKAGGYATDPNYASKLTASIATARKHHDGGWTNVEDATPFGAGTGLSPDGGADRGGWEDVPGAKPQTQTADTPAPPQAGIEPGGYSLGGLAKNAGTDLSDMWEGVKGLGKRAADDVSGVVNGRPQQAAGDLVSIMKATNPFFSFVKDVQRGIPLVKNAIQDPAQAAKDVADYVYQKPVTTAMNAATIAFPGAGGAVKGVLAAPGKVGGPVIRGGTELLSGVSADAQKIASKAGELGGDAGAAFRKNMKSPDYTGMQDTVRQAKQDARVERNTEYQKGIADVDAANPNPLKDAYDPAIQASQDARAEAYNGTFLKHPDVPAVMDDVDAAINEHFNDATQSGKALSMDALKQRIGSIMQGTKEGTTARRAVSKVYNAVRDDISAQTPGYGDVMTGYGKAARSINDAVSSLGAGERVSRFSTTGKLLSSLRSDASVARGAREQSLADMAKHQPTLPYQIAGAIMNPVTPRGIVARMGAVHAAGAAAFIPALIKALPLLAASSPRLAGEFRYAIGAAKRGARTVGATQRNIGNLADIARIISSQNKDN